MAAIAMNRRVLEHCRYRWHESGEDLGFAQDLDRIGARCAWDTGLKARHLERTWDETAAGAPPRHERARRHRRRSSTTARRSSPSAAPTVAIVNYRTPELAVRCAESALEKGLAAEVRIVDVSDGPGASVDPPPNVPSTTSRTSATPRRSTTASPTSPRRC
jgi:hypothetical protein